MSMRTLLVSAALLVICGAVSSQPPAVYPPAPVSPMASGFPVPVTPPTPPVAPTVPGRSTAPPTGESVDDLLNELERLQAQKAELEKKEQELKATLRKKLEKQSERLQKLGVAPKEPDRVGLIIVGRIIIQGNTKTPDGKILEKLEMCPGQILQYPTIEAARVKLAKLGFRSVKVEVLSNDLDSTLKDIRVTVEEANPNNY